MPSGRLVDTRQEIISDRVAELHFERSKDFGHDVKCYAQNNAGYDSKQEKIPCKLIIPSMCM